MSFDLRDALFGLGAGIVAHDVAVHEGLPMDRIHGWHVGAALAGGALLWKLFEEGVL